MTDQPLRIETFSFRRDSLLMGETAEERNAILDNILEQDRLEWLLRQEDAMIAQWQAEREALEAAEANEAQ